MARSPYSTLLPACNRNRRRFGRRPNTCPCIAFINKMDRVGADFKMSIDSMRQKLGANAWPVLLPGKEDQFKGQIDVINKKAVIYSDSDQLGSTYDLCRSSR